MTSINENFFNPIVFRTPEEEPKTWGYSALKWIDSVFYLGGRKVCILPEPTYRHADGKQGALLIEEQQPRLTVVAKVISCIVVFWILPILIGIKYSLRQQHQFYLIDLKQELEKEIPEARVQLAWNAIAKGHRKDLVDAHGNLMGRCRPFQAEGFPDLVFKPTNNQGRIKSSIEAKKCCLLYRLNHLIIPAVRSFTASNGQLYVVEQYIETPHEKNDQLQLWKYEDLDLAAQDLSIFTVKFGLGDIVKRNILVSNKKFVLVDLEARGYPDLIGDLSSPGLINIFEQKSHLDILARVLEQEKIDAVTYFGKPKTLAPHIAYSYEYLKKNTEDVERFYEQQGLTEPKQPLEVPLENLGLDLDRRGYLIKPIRSANPTDEELKRNTIYLTLEEACNHIIKAINDQILRSNPHHARSIQRRVTLVTDWNIQMFNSTRWNPEELTLAKFDAIRNGNVKNSEFPETPWVEEILQALKEKGYIFDYASSRTDLGWIVQA